MDRQYISAAFTRLLVALCALLLIVALIYHTADLGATTLSTVITEEKSFENIIVSDGYFFRSETVLSLDTGTAYSTLKAGENVTSGEKVATVYPIDSDVATLQNYDRLLALLDSADSAQNISAITAELKKLSAELREDHDAGALSAMAAKTDELQKLFNCAAQITGSAEIRTEADRLKAERASLLSEFGAPIKDICASVAGCYYPTCDGYESLFSAEKIGELTVSSFEELIKKDPVPTENAGKVVTNSYWYMATVVNKNALLNSVIGKDYTVYIGSNKEKFSLRLERVSVDRDGRSLLIFGCRVTPKQLPDRAESISIVADTAVGLTVPTAAVRVLTDEADNRTVGVYVREGNYLRFKRIEILTEQKGCYLVKTLAQIEKEQTKNEQDVENPVSSYPYLTLNDVVVTSGKDLKEGYFK